MTDNKISRREFLTMAGAAGIGLIAAKFMFFDGGSSRKREAQAQTNEPWSSGYITDIAPIHAILLPTGKILAIAGSGYHAETMNGPFLAQVIDPPSGQGATFTMPEDLFCCGHSHLANGNLLITGGQLQYDIQNPEGRFRGLDAVYEFNIYTNRFQKLQDMPHGRWYPTLIALPDGRQWILDGLDEYGGRNALIEIYDPATKTTSIQYRPDADTTYTVGQGSSLPGAGTQTYGGPGQGVSPFTSLYPRIHLMPSGLLLIAGMADIVWLVNPGPDTNSGIAPGAWVNIGNTTPDWRDYGTSFLYPLNNTSGERGRVLITGGSLSWADDALATSYIIDFDAGTNAAPVIRTGPPLSTGRSFLTPVTMPDGRITVFGGVTRTTEDHVHTAESFDPIAESWTTIPAAAGVSRSYHSTALLLPDGRVWTASGTPNRASWEHRVEFYNPPYYYADRPSITGRIVGTAPPYGGTMRIPTSSSVSRVSLVRLGSNTHHYDANMRLVWLQITGSYSDGIEVAAPLNARIAPPGPYMVHILDSSNVPSQGQIIQVGT